MNLAMLIFEGLKEASGLTEQDAENATKKLIAWAKKNGHAGAEHYLPCKFSPLSPEEKKEKIKKEFNGQNLKAICRRYDVAPATVYRAIKG